MNIHPTKAEKKRLRVLCGDFEFLFQIQNYDRVTVYKSERSTGETDCAADIEVDEKYQRITICIYPSFWDHSPNEQRAFILHEFCHTLTDPMNQLVYSLLEGKLQTNAHRSAAVEKSTSSIANILDGFLRSRYKYVRTAYKKYLPAGKKKRKKKRLSTVSRKKQ